jgi:hypothetical protein
LQTPKYEVRKGLSAQPSEPGLLAARSSASSGVTGVRASTSLAGGFLGLLALLFFTVRLRLIFALRFLAM